MLTIFHIWILWLNQSEGLVELLEPSRTFRKCSSWFTAWIRRLNPTHPADHFLTWAGNGAQPGYNCNFISHPIKNVLNQRQHPDLCLSLVMVTSCWPQPAVRWTVVMVTAQSGIRDERKSDVIWFGWGRWRDSVCGAFRRKSGSCCGSVWFSVWI